MRWRPADSFWFWFLLPIVLLSALVLIVRSGGEQDTAADAAAVFHYPLF